MRYEVVEKAFPAKETSPQFFEIPSINYSRCKDWSQSEAYEVDYNQDCEKTLKDVVFKKI